MEFQCENCSELFHPHRFIALKHPSQAKCPKCNSKGYKTKKGTKEFKEIHHAINQANVEAAKALEAGTLKEKAGE